MTSRNSSFAIASPLIGTDRAGFVREFFEATPLFIFAIAIKVAIGHTSAR